jgi:hypothetical protein
LDGIVTVAKHIYENWCELHATQIAAGCILHLIRERAGARANVHAEIIETVHGHYEDPSHLAARIQRVGFPKAAKVLAAMMPKTKKARSGHLGEILATEVVPALLPHFVVPIKRLRWNDGRETALRGEDVIGIAQNPTRVRFLKGESKSRAALTPTVVAEAREALNANHGLPSQHAMTFVMQRLFDIGNDALALIFEEFLIDKTIPARDMVHLLFTFSGNDGSATLAGDLRSAVGNIEQHAVNFQINDHQDFIASVYKQ